MDPIANNNDMNDEVNDTQALLTAYALGELEGDDLAKAEALIASDPAAKAEVQEIRRVGKQLEEALAAEGAGETAGLKPEQVQAIHARAEKEPETQDAVVARLVRPWVWWTAGSAAAALFAVALFVPQLGPNHDAGYNSSQDVAIVDPQSGDGNVNTSALPLTKEQSERRDKEVQNLLHRAQALRKEKDYDRALQLVNQALFLNPNDYSAQAMKDILEDSIVLTRQYDNEHKQDINSAKHRVDNIEATTPPSELLVYPPDWPQRSARKSPPKTESSGEDEKRKAGKLSSEDKDSRADSSNAKGPEFELSSVLKSPASAQSTSGVTSPVSPSVAGQPVPSESNSPLIGAERARSSRSNKNDEVAQYRELAAVAKKPVNRTSPSVALRKKQVVQMNLMDQEEQRLVRDTGGINPNFHTEAYDTITDNPFLKVGQNPLSTFSIDVDTASYANVRRFLTQNQLPPAGAVRIEEMVNYFPYEYSNPAGDERPFAVHVETGSAPWAHEHRLVKIGIKGKDIVAQNKPVTNLVFLIDVSGSMTSPDKLPLLKEGMKLLVRKMDAKDHVAIAVYAGAAGMVLDSTSGNEQDKIMAAIDNLQSGGSTNGGAGIRLAYDLATKNFVKEGVNRVILASDGDFNVGTTSQDELVKLIEEKRKTGVFLSVLGFGTGNLKDSTMEKIANKGNGNYSYIDTIKEAQKVLVEQGAGTLYTIAKDVKIQVEFNPAKVQAYRLIGYENRMLAKEDFNDDTKDAGEIGAGHTVTALYEVVPVGVKAPGIPPVDALKYQTPAPAEKPAVSGGKVNVEAASNELLTVKLRYKQPDGDVSTKMDVPVIDAGKSWQDASQDYRFAAGVAQFGMLLRNSPYKGDSTYAQVLDLAQSGMGKDEKGYRGEFIQLVQKARELSNAAQNRSE